MTDTAAQSSVMRQSIEQHSFRPAGVPLDAEPRSIVIVPPPGFDAGVTHRKRTLADAFAIARPLVAAGEMVRIAAFSATIDGHRPTWTEGNDRLVLTELGAYRAESPVLATRELVPSVEAWLDELFADLIPEVADAGHFYASACQRVLQPLFDALPYARGLHAAHPGARFLCTEPDWPGMTVLASLAGKRTEPTPPHRGWSLKLYGAIAYQLARALAGQVRNRIRAGPARRRLAQLRRSGGDAQDARLWLALWPDWPRVNAHVHATVTAKAVKAGLPLGALLCSSLAAGERTEDGRRVKDHSALWPGLDPLDPAKGDTVVEQCVAPLELGRWLSTMASGVRACWRVARRISAAGPGLRIGPVELNLSSDLQSLAALATTDVLQAVSAAAAVRELLSRHDFAGRTVVFSSLALIDTATVEAMLRAAGATTVDFKHGAGGDGWHGMHETRASFAAVWTRPDEELVRQLGQAALVIPPVTGARGRRRRASVTNVLLISGYAHASWRLVGYPLRPFQQELLRAATLLEQARPGRFRFRWRPHPADDAALVAEDARDVPFVECSTAAALDDDLDWSDAVLTYGGTTMALAIRAAVPVFVHAPPHVQAYPDIQAIPPERRFFYAHELLPKFLRFVDRREVGDDDVLATDRNLCAAFSDEGRTAFECGIALP